MLVRMLEEAEAAAVVFVTVAVLLPPLSGRGPERQCCPMSCPKCRSELMSEVCLKWARSGHEVVA